MRSVFPLLKSFLSRHHYITLIGVSDGEIADTNQTMESAAKSYESFPAHIRRLNGPIKDVTT